MALVQQENHQEKKEEIILQKNQRKLQQYPKQTQKNSFYNNTGKPMPEISR